MQPLSGILTFMGLKEHNATTKFYLLLGGALLHDFAAWYARECIGQQQHDMLEELEEEALQVQHSHIMLQETVETHRSCRASSFCSEIERFINQHQSAANAYRDKEDRSSWSWNYERLVFGPRWQNRYSCICFLPMFVVRPFQKVREICEND